MFLLGYAKEGVAVPGGFDAEGTALNSEDGVRGISTLVLVWFLLLLFVVVFSFNKSEVGWPSVVLTGVINICLSCC